MEIAHYFKSCTTCNTHWQTRADLLDDPNVLLIGYQAFIGHPEKGLILFEHHVTGCGTSMAISIGSFQDFYHGEYYDELMYGSEDCPGYCLDPQNLRVCSNKCKMAFAREIVAYIEKVKAHVLTKSDLKA